MSADASTTLYRPGRPTLPPLRSLLGRSPTIQGAVNAGQATVDSISLLLLFALTVFVVYFLPLAVGLAYFAILIAFFYRTNSDHFWLAFLLVITSKPGNLFHSFGVGHDFGGAGVELPEVSIAAGITVSVIDAFFAAALVKALARGKRYRYLLSRPLLVLLGYAIVLVFVSLLAFDTPIVRLLKDLRSVFYLSCFVTIAYLLVSPKSIYRLIYTILPSIFLVLTAQVYFYVTGEHLANRFAPDLITTVMRMGEGARYLTFGGDVLLGFLCLVLSLVLISIRRDASLLSSLYLYGIAALSVLSMFLTGTRVWFVALAIVGLIGFLSMRLKGGVIAGMIVAIALTSLSVSSIPKLEEGVVNAWARISTLAGLGTAGNDATLQVEGKIEKRLPHVLEGFRQSPVFGYGFSEEVHEYMDRDVGNFSLLVEVGVLGFFAFVYLWISYFMMIRYPLRVTRSSNPYRGALRIFGAALLGLLAAHFTTNGMYGYLIGPSSALFHAVFLFLTEFMVLESIRHDRIFDLRPGRTRIAAR